MFINRTEIPFSNSINYLGVTLDKKLTYKKHVGNICNKVIRCARALYPILNRKSKLITKNKCLLYNLCIKPILTYACIIWKNWANSHKKRLQIIQNKNLKIIYNFSRIYIEFQAQKTIKMLINNLTQTFYDRCSRSTFSHLRSLQDYQEMFLA